MVRLMRPSLIAISLVLAGAALAGESELSVATEPAPASGRAWTTAALVGGGALLFAAGYNDGSQDPGSASPTLVGASFGVSGMGVAGLGYWWLLEDAGVTSTAGLVTSVAAFQLGWLGVYLLGNGAGLMGADGERLCRDFDGGCAAVADNKGAYTMSLLAGAGGLLAAGALTGVVLYGADAGHDNQHSGNRHRLSFVPGPSGATLMGSF